MAIEVLKSAGLAAYQGSNRKPTVKTVEAKAKSKPQVSTEEIKSENIAEKAVDTVDRRPEKSFEQKPKKGNTEPMTDGSDRVQEKSAKEPAKATKFVIPDNTQVSEEKIPTEALKRAVEEMNKNATNSEAVFGVHDSTNRVTIKIVDKQTKEVLKESPPEKTLDMIAKVWELAGLLVDEKG